MKSGTLCQHISHVKILAYTTFPGLCVFGIPLTLNLQIFLNAFIQINMNWKCSSCPPHKIMLNWYVSLQLTVFALVAVSFAQDDDYYEPEPRHRPAPARIQAGYSGPAAPRPTPVPILKQINRYFSLNSR